MLNESEAWGYLAGVWQTARASTIKHRFGFYLYTVYFNEIECPGLCRSIEVLELNHLVSEDTAINMRAKIEAKQGPFLGRAYLWPRDEAGKESRVEFCLLMQQETT